MRVMLMKFWRNFENILKDEEFNAEKKKLSESFGKYLRFCGEIYHVLKLN